MTQDSLAVIDDLYKLKLQVDDYRKEIGRLKQKNNKLEADLKRSQREVDYYVRIQRDSGDHPVTVYDEAWCHEKGTQITFIRSTTRPNQVKVKVAPGRYVIKKTLKEAMIGAREKYPGTIKLRKKSKKK
jgi:hypothetical protein